MPGMGFQISRVWESQAFRASYIIWCLRGGWKWSWSWCMRIIILRRLFLFCKYRSSFFCLQDARLGVSDSRVWERAEHISVCIVPVLLVLTIMVLKQPILYAFPEGQDKQRRRRSCAPDWSSTQNTRGGKEGSEERTSCSKPGFSSTWQWDDHAKLSSSAPKV